MFSTFSKINPYGKKGGEMVQIDKESINLIDIHIIHTHLVTRTQALYYPYGIQHVLCEISIQPVLFEHV